jgi:hypothetical protein
MQLLIFMIQAASSFLFSNGACNLCLLFPTHAVHCPTHHSGSTARNGNFCGGDRTPKRGTLYPQRPRDPNRCQEKPAKGGQNWQVFTNCQMARLRGGAERDRTACLPPSRLEPVSEKRSTALRAENSHSCLETVRVLDLAACKIGAQNDSK